MQTPSQPVPNTQLKGFNLAAGLLLQLSIYKKVTVPTALHTTAPAMEAMGSTSASASRHQGPGATAQGRPPIYFRGLGAV